MMGRQISDFRTIIMDVRCQVELGENRIHSASTYMYAISFFDIII